MREERQRYYDFCDGETDSLVTLRGQERSDKNPPEWAEFVHAEWLTAEVTREFREKEGRTAVPA